MTTFHPQQSDRGRRARKKAERQHASNSRHKLPPPNCTVMFTKREKSGATIFKALCKRTVVEYVILYRASLTPCQNKVFTARQSSPMTARSPARRSRDGRETSGKTSGEISRVISAQSSRQWPGSGNGNAAECPAGRLARQLALRRTRTRHVRAGNLRDDSQHGRATAVPQSSATSRKTTRSNLNHDIQKL